MVNKHKKQQREITVYFYLSKDGKAGQKKNILKI
jgi:hypothetical protein